MNNSNFKLPDDLITSIDNNHLRCEVNRLGAEIEIELDLRRRSAIDIELGPKHEQESRNTDHSENEHEHSPTPAIDHESHEYCFPYRPKLHFLLGYLFGTIGIVINPVLYVDNASDVLLFIINVSGLVVTLVNCIGSHRRVEYHDDDEEGTVHVAAGIPVLLFLIFSIVYLVQLV